MAGLEVLILGLERTEAGTHVGDVTVSEHFSKGVIFTTDIYCTLSGTGAIVYVIYEEIEG